MSTTPSLCTKHFQSGPDFARYALGAEAPRYSFYLAPGLDDTTGLDRTLGLSPGDALFSDDLDALVRAVMRWNDNGYRAELVRAFETSSAPARWRLSANQPVPAWVFDSAFDHPLFRPAATATTAQAEALAVRYLGEMLAPWDRESPADRVGLAALEAERSYVRETANLSGF